MSDKEQARTESAAATKAETEFGASGVLPEGSVYDPSAIRRDESPVRKATADEKAAQYDIRNPPHPAKKG